MSKEEKIAASITHLAEFMRDSEVPTKTFACAGYQGVLVIVAKHHSAESLRYWVSKRNGEPQKLKKPMHIRAIEREATEAHKGTEA